MSLGFDTLSALPGLRAEAESRFTETFTAFYATRVLSDITGQYEDTEVVVHADVPGRLKFPSLMADEREQGAQVKATQHITVNVAVGSTPNVAVDHVWRVTASSIDGSLVGRELRTKFLPQAGQVTAWRYPVEQVI